MPELTDDGPLDKAALSRDELIDTAVKFLKNPRVQSSSSTQKNAFLQSKGLSQSEVEEAHRRAGMIQNALQTARPLDLLDVRQQATQSSFSKIRDIVNIVVIIGGGVIAFIYFLKNCVWPYVLNRRLQQEKIEKELADFSKSLTAAIQELKTSVIEQQALLERLVEMSSQHQLTDLKSEVVSLKSLMLNRRQFPLTPQISGIPSWQRSDEGQEEPEPSSWDSSASMTFEKMTPPNDVEVAESVPNERETQ